MPIMASSKPSTNGNSATKHHLTNGSSSMGHVKGLTNGNAAPSETDLDYISRPENYSGSNLQSLQRFIIAKEKQQKSQQQSNKKKKRRKEEDDLFRRYRHILPLDESFNPSESDDSDDNYDDEKEEEGSPNRGGVVVANGGTGGGSVGKKPIMRQKSEAFRPQSNRRRVSDVENPVKRSASVGDDATLSQSPSSGYATDRSPRYVRKNSGVASSSDVTCKSDPLTLKSESSLTLVSPSETGIGGELGGGGTDSMLNSSGRRAWTRALVKNRFANLSAEVKSCQIRRKFAQAIKAVISIRKLAAIMIKKSEEPSAMLQTFTDVIDTPDDFSENLRNQGLSFDPSYFKANKEISVSSEVKNILNLPPSSRTQEQIQTAMYGLQSLPSFAEYPLHMQEKLTKVAWYEKVPPKRTIIRQGHYAENFYFILSGQAVVTIMMYDPKTNESMPRTANFMRKGTSFGELALLHHSRRTATVTSHDTVQLLSIGREDFFDIFMSRQGTDEVPEHIRFISQLDFMKGWPIERLVEHPEHCLLHFFKRNVVIVQDSKRSDWLYIVKSGSCQVLKQLRGVTAKLGIRKYEGTLDERFHLPHTGTSIRGPKVDTGLFRPRPRSHRSLAESCTSSEEQSTKATPPPGLPRLCGPRKQRPASLSPTSTPRSFPPPPPVFVQVSSLKPRDVFGLELVRFHDELDSAQTSVSLVSRGAECIMLSKDFFRKHANEMVKKNLQELVRPYPDEITFQESLQRKADWDLFKHKLIEDITSLPIT